MHGGYIKKPGRGAIDALCGMYAAINDAVMIAPSGEGKPRFGIPMNRKQPKVGDQLSLF